MLYSWATAYTYARANANSWQIITCSYLCDHAAGGEGARYIPMYTRSKIETTRCRTATRTATSANGNKGEKWVTPTTDILLSLPTANVFAISRRPLPHEHEPLLQLLKGALVLAPRQVSRARPNLFHHLLSAKKQQREDRGGEEETGINAHGDGEFHMLRQEGDNNKARYRVASTTHVI